MSETGTYSPRLTKVVEEFGKAPKALRLPLLLEYAGRLPDPPEGMGELEQVHECQTPLFLKADVRDDETVALYFKAPEEAPTTRGFAAVVHAAFDGAHASEILGTPEDFYVGMGLSELISPLRLRGLSALLARVKRQVRKQVAA